MCSHLLADVQDVCDRIAILYQGELKELGRVDSLLKVRDEPRSGPPAQRSRPGRDSRGDRQAPRPRACTMDNPTTTLEELFLTIVRESEARPGRRSASLSDGRS